MQQRKLLFLGADTSTEDAVRYAQSIGVYSIVTDYRPTEMVREKQMADEAWMIDVSDTDALERRCREENISAVYAGNHEFCLDQCKELCARLGLPFYASDEGWKAARDKAFYQDICTECGLAVPAWVRVNDKMELSKLVDHLEFPIVVKPTDSCAQQGLSIVQDPADLYSAVKKALSYSKCKEVIAEEFIHGEDIFVLCYVHHGQFIHMCTYISIPRIINGRKNFGYSIRVNFSEQFIHDTIISGYEKVVKRLKCQEGPCLFQGIYRNGILYNIEFGYRLDGVRSWRLRERSNGISELQMAVHYALGTECTDRAEELLPVKNDEKVYALYYLWSKPGHIKTITGLSSLYARKDLLFLVDRFREGETVENLDNMRSMAYLIDVYGKGHKEIDRKIMEINESLHMLDDNGQDMLLYSNDYYSTWCKYMSGDLD